MKALQQGPNLCSPDVMDYTELSLHSTPGRQADSFDRKDACDNHLLVCPVPDGDGLVHIRICQPGLDRVKYKRLHLHTMVAS